MKRPSPSPRSTLRPPLEAEVPPQALDVGEQVVRRVGRQVDRRIDGHGQDLLLHDSCVPGFSIPRDSLR